MTARQIAAVLGCSKTSVETAMKHHGLKRALVLPKGNT
jgi:biotin operon repressor